MILQFDFYQKVFLDSLKIDLQLNRHWDLQASIKTMQDYNFPKFHFCFDFYFESPSRHEPFSYQIHAKSFPLFAG